MIKKICFETSRLRNKKTFENRYTLNSGKTAAENKILLASK